MIRSRKLAYLWVVLFARLSTGQILQFETPAVFCVSHYSRNVLRVVFFQTGGAESRLERISRIADNKDKFWRFSVKFSVTFGKIWHHFWKGSMRSTKRTKFFFWRLISAGQSSFSWALQKKQNFIYLIRVLLNNTFDCLVHWKRNMKIFLSFCLFGSFEKEMLVISVKGGFFRLYIHKHFNQNCSCRIVQDLYVHKIHSFSLITVHCQLKSNYSFLTLVKVVYLYCGDAWKGPTHWHRIFFSTKLFFAHGFELMKRQLPPPLQSLCVTWCWFWFGQQTLKAFPIKIRSRCSSLKYSHLCTNVFRLNCSDK